MPKNKVLVIVGTTASGKSSLALKLAKEFKGEIISGDSVSIYREYNIGSAKPSENELKEVKHYLINHLSAFEDYSIFNFQQDARQAIETINHQNHLPIIVGGSGLYIKACIYDYQFSNEKNISHKYDAYDNQTLKEMLDARDKASSLKIHINNRRRLIRALEICDNLSETKSQFEAKQSKEKLYDCLMIGIKKPRPKLYQDIEIRVNQMFDQGLLEEVNELVTQGIFRANSFNKAIGYKEFKAYFDKQISLDEVKYQIIKNTKNYAKRQDTWFKNQEQVKWFAENDFNDIVETIRRWLNE